MKKEDLFSGLRDAQFALSQELAADLARILDAALWFPLAVTEDTDPDAVRLLVTKELEHQVHNAVLGYTDWAATVIVRSGKYGDRAVPAPEEDMVRAICGKYDVKEPILGYVVMRMALRDSIPLLGAVKRGMLVPDKKALKEWASFFDWTAGESGIG